jgi:uncharacterized protein (DUF427 family)
MGLAWQHGPLAATSVGRFLTPNPLPELLLFLEPLRRRMRVRLGEMWVADSEDVVLLHEPDRHPVAYFPQRDVSPGILIPNGHVTRHPTLGQVTWLRVDTAQQDVENAAWQHDSLPSFAAELRGRVAFGWCAMTAFYEEDERIVGHATDFYHRVDIRATSRHLLICDGERVIADTRRPLALYESGSFPRWYVPRQDVLGSALQPADGQSFCPYKGLASYYSVGTRDRAAWSYLSPRPEAERVRTLVSFDPGRIDVFLDGEPLRPEPLRTALPDSTAQSSQSTEMLYAAALSD